MKEATIKKSITLQPIALSVATIISILGTFYPVDVHRILRTVAAHFDLTVSK